MINCTNDLVRPGLIRSRTSYAVYNWESAARPRTPMYVSVAVFAAAMTLSLASFLALHPQIERIHQESSILINAMFAPALAIGFLYGVRVTAKAVTPSETRSPARRSVIKFFLFFFVIGGLFSSVNFAMNGGSVAPITDILDDGLVAWATEYVTANGGATFLIVSSILLMAAATSRLVRLGGVLNTIFTFAGTFAFFFMLALSFTQSNPTNSEVYLFTFYQAGIVGGALYEMNKLTRNYNNWEDYQNGYL